MSCLESSPKFLDVILLRFPIWRPLIGCALALLVGCEKKKQPASMPASATEAAPNDLPSVQARPAPQNTSGAPVSQPASPNPIPVQPIVVDATDNTTAVLAQLTQALRKFSFEHRRVPKSLSEVIGAGYVTAMPQAPPGKQFAVDAKRVEVVLVK